MVETLDIQTQLQERWMLFWWGLGIGLLVLGIGCKQGLFKSNQTLPKRPPPFIGGVDLLKGFGYFLLAEILIIPFFFGLIYHVAGWNTNIGMQAKGLLHLLMILGGFGAVLIAYSEMMPKQRQQLWGEGSLPWYRHLGIGVVACLISFPLVLSMTQIISITVWHIFHQPFIDQTVVQNLKEMLANPALFFSFGLIIMTVVPFTEEFLFRGLLQTWLKQKFHYTPAAIATSSLVFALFHYSSEQGMTNIELLCSLFVLSCVIGYIYERQRSLWAPIGMHAFYNFMSVLMIFLDQS